MNCPQADRIRYNPLCSCAHCRTQTFITFGHSAYSEQEFILRSRGYKLSQAQQKVVDEMSLKLWNDSVKGEIAR